MLEAGGDCFYDNFKNSQVVSFSFLDTWFFFFLIKVGNSSKEQFCSRYLEGMFTISWTLIFQFPSHGMYCGDWLCRLFLLDMAKCIICSSLSFQGKHFKFCPYPGVPSDYLWFWIFSFLSYFLRFCFKTQILVFFL